MPLIVASGAAIGARVRGISNHRSVCIGTRDVLVGVVVNHLAERVSSQKLKVVREAFVRLDREAVINRVGIALELQDAVEASNRPRQRELLIGQNGTGAGDADVGWGCGRAEVDVARACQLIPWWPRSGWRLPPRQPKLYLEGMILPRVLHYEWTKNGEKVSRTPASYSANRVRASPVPKVLVAGVISATTKGKIFLVFLDILDGYFRLRTR